MREEGGMLWEMGHGLVGSSIRRMAPATQAADRRITNSKPSLETRVTYSEGWEVIISIVEIEDEAIMIRTIQSVPYPHS